MKPVAVAALALCLAGCRGKPVTRDECDRLLDRYTEMLLRRDDPKVKGADVDAARASARAAASADRPFQACSREVSREQMDCALAAYDPDAVERCLIPMP